MTEANDWDHFLKNTREDNFLQRWFWGDFQQELGKKVWRIQVGEREILAQAQVIEENLLPHLVYFYLPFGPAFKKNLSPSIKERVENNLLDKLKELGQRRKAVFLRIEPYQPLLLKPEEGYTPLKRIQPQQTRILDLHQSLEQILKGFSARSRYNIRLAQKRGLRLIRCHQIDSQNQKYLVKFNQLIQITSRRKHFHAYPKSYYQKLLTKALTEGWGELFLAKYQEQIIGAYFLIFSHHQATCLHGAVDYRYRFLKASHFLQWEQIKTAKERGCLVYDFWGIDEKLWPGVTFFKKSFGGQTLKYPPGVEIVWRPQWYSWYKIYKKIKRV